MWSTTSAAMSVWNLIIARYGWLESRSQEAIQTLTCVATQSAVL
jgi:hypothetical protein